MPKHITWGFNKVRILKFCRKDKGWFLLFNFIDFLAALHYYVRLH